MMMCDVEPVWTFEAHDYGQRVRHDWVGGKGGGSLCAACGLVATDEDDYASECDEALRGMRVPDEGENEV